MGRTRQSRVRIWVSRPTRIRRPSHARDDATATTAPARAEIPAELAKDWDRDAGRRGREAVGPRGLPALRDTVESIYDHRTVAVRDSPLRDLAVRLIVRKRRFSCRPCGRPFTEPVPGILPGYRSTERYRRSLLWACENFSDLTQVRRAYRCSSGYLYKALYTQLELQRRKRLYPWPTVIGVDEHYFRRGRGGFSAIRLHGGRLQESPPHGARRRSHRR